MGFTNEIRRETAIDATAEEVWDILSDFRRYPEWNPGFTAIEGRAEVGTTLDVTFAPNAKGRSMTMHPIVLAADPGRELRWRGRLLLPFVFDGEHRFRIDEAEPGRVRFVQSERFRGVLVPFLRRLIEEETAGMFERANAALAARVSAVRTAA